MSLCKLIPTHIDQRRHHTLKRTSVFTTMNNRAERNGFVPAYAHLTYILDCKTIQMTKCKKIADGG